MAGTDHGLRNPQIDHEPSDANTAAITKFGISLAVLIVLVLAMMGLLHACLAKREARRSPQPSPLAVERPKSPSEPRLQDAPMEDLRSMRSAEDAVLNSYGWVDPDKGIARIPIEEALDAIANAKPSP